MPKQQVRLALVGGETLLGKEIEEVLGARTQAAVIGFSANGEGNFGEVDGEAVYIEALGASAIAGARAMVIAGSPEGARKAYDLAKAEAGRLLVIDCKGHLERQPEARLVAPLVSDPETPSTWLLEVAHPAASALALVMKRLERYRRLKQIVVTIFEPASEQDKRGLSELHQQTTGLLSFKPLEKQVFDAQLSFNLLSQYGTESAAKLAAIEERVERHLATILASDRIGGGLPFPSLRVVAAPVFHGYSLSVWASFEGDITAQEIGEALASAQIEIRGKDEEPPDNVSAASQSGLIAGDIRVDRNDPHAAWIWVVGDNLRLTADAVADLVNNLERPRQ